MHIQNAIAEAVEIQIHRYRYRLISKERLDEISRINSHVTSLRKKRNKIALFCWCRENDETIFGTGFPGGVPTKKNDRASATLTLAELGTLNTEAHALVERLMTVLSALPEISEESLLAPRLNKDLD